MPQANFIVAFAGGVVTFFTPCILPMIPVYVSFFLGQAVTEKKDSDNRTGLFLNTLSFIIGFTLVFVALGATATTLGKFLSHNFLLFNKIASILMIFFGFTMLGVFKFKWLFMEKRFHLGRLKPGLVSSFFFGLAFAFGWTPCIGPVLGSILALAGLQTSVYKGMLLLSVYSLGLAIPFLIVSVAIDNIFVVFQKIKKYSGLIQYASGIILVLLGILLLLGKLRFTGV